MYNKYNKLTISKFNKSSEMTVTVDTSLYKATFDIWHSTGAHGHVLN